MKKNYLPLLILSWILIAFSACRKSDAPILPQAPNDQLSAQMMKAFFEKYAPKNQVFSIDAALGGTVTLASGTVISFPPQAFVNEDGDPVSGIVDLFVRDVLNATGMILADKPTQTVDGEMLESFGEIFVDARKKDTALKLNPLQKPVQVQVPIAIGANGNMREIPMWDGDTTITQTLSGYNHENAMVSITNEIQVNRGVAWSQIPGWGLSSPANTIFPLDALGQWRNCDALYFDTRPKTTVLGYFGDKFNPETGQEYTGQAPSMLFFKTAGTNTLIKLYNTIMLPAAGKEGFVSYQQSMPVGQEGTFLAISARHGKFYADMQDATIGAPASGKNYVAFDFDLEEVSESQLLNLINQMSTK